MPTRVLISDGLAAEGISALEKLPNIDLLNHSNIERSALKEILPTVEVLVVRSRTQVDRDLLAGARNLKLAIRAGIGLDNIDVSAATDLGIVVMNAPTGNIVTTAEHAIAMLFAVSRCIPQADASMRTGKWEKKKFQGHEIRGKTLGLLGLGNIGKVVADRAQGLKMNVIAYDPFLSPERAARCGVGLVAFDELLAQSDYISVHAPLMESTRNLIDASAFAKMKMGLYLINCARGGIVNEAALIEALDAGIVQGAALDVFEKEPLPANHPLLGRADVVLTPHLGASTDEAQVQVGLEVADQIKQYLEDGAYKNAINVPNVSSEQMDSLKPYLNLAENIGAFSAQAFELEQVSKLGVQFEGLSPEIDRSILTLSVLKGFLTSLLSTPVNYVNAKKLLTERGIQLEVTEKETCTHYGCLISLTVDGEQAHTCAGTLFGKNEPRIVRVDSFVIDAVPSEHLLFTKNVDTPGVIGAMGTVLGKNGVNISAMHLGRNRQQGEAISVIGLDSDIESVPLHLLREIPGMVSVRAVRL